MNFSDFFEALGVAAFGTKTGEPINCGAGLAIEDGISGGADDSYMVVIGDVTPKMFRDFLASLASSGRKETFHREVNGNIFSEFAEENRIIYTYFTREAEQARVIIDNASCPLSEMNDNEPDVRGDTALMQFSLKYGSMVRYHSCDCGMLYVLRLRDNSVIIIDGGEIEQDVREHPHKNARIGRAAASVLLRQIPEEERRQEIGAFAHLLGELPEKVRAGLAALGIELVHRVHMLLAEPGAALPETERAGHHKLIQLLRKTAPRDFIKRLRVGDIGFMQLLRGAFPGCRHGAVSFFCRPDGRKLRSHYTTIFLFVNGFLNLCRTLDIYI